jgi:hypothetical protein
VGTLVRSEHFANFDGGHTELLQEKSRKGSAEDLGKPDTVTKQPRKRATKKATAADGEKPPPKPRARKTKADSDGAARDTKSPYFEDADIVPEPQDASTEAAPTLTKAGKPRKPRTKKEKVEGDAEPKLKKARAVKPKATKSTKTESQGDATVGSHVTVSELKSANWDSALNADNENPSIWDMPSSPHKNKKASSKQVSPGPPADGLDLEQAVVRRREWTPPMDSVAQSPFTEPTGKENKHTSQDGKNSTFTHMVSNFTYESPTARLAGTTAKTGPANTGVTKRRRVEVSIPDDLGERTQR